MIRMCERAGCKNFAFHIKRLASPGYVVLTSCVPRLDRNSTKQHAASKSLRLFYGSEVEAVGTDIYSASFIDLTSHTAGTTLAGTAEGGDM
jgi:hypothetical protein